jgi:hypothetical protein
MVSRRAVRSAEIRPAGYRAVSNRDLGKPLVISDAAINHGPSGSASSALHTHDRRIDLHLAITREVG